MEIERRKHHKLLLSIQWILVALLAIVLFWAIWAIAREIRLLKHEGYIRRRQSQASLPMSYQIRSWMTFHYINVVFKVPESYLKNSLKITDKRYPAISIDEWAETKKQPVDQSLYLVIGAVQEFLNQPSP